MSVLADNDPRIMFDCGTCLDTGWASFRCPGNHTDSGRDGHLRRIPCAHRMDHGPAHTYVERCGCVEVNPTLLRQREAEASRRASQGTKRRHREQ